MGGAHAAHLLLHNGADPDANNRARLKPAECAPDGGEWGDRSDSGEVEYEDDAKDDAEDGDSVVDRASA